MIRRPPRSTRTDTLFPYTTLFRSSDEQKALLQDICSRALAGFKALSVMLTPVLPVLTEKVARELFDQGALFQWADAAKLPQRIAPFKHLMQRRSEEHTSELQSLMRISYAVFCLTTKNNTNPNAQTHNHKYHSN